MLGMEWGGRGVNMHWEQDWQEHGGGRGPWGNGAQVL